MHQRLNPYKKRYTYNWDLKGSLDDFVKGWITTDIISTLKNHYVGNSNKAITELLKEWSNKTIDSCGVCGGTCVPPTSTTGTTNTATIGTAGTTAATTTTSGHMGRGRLKRKGTKGTEREGGRR